MLNFTGAYEGNEKYICICCSDQDKYSVNPVVSRLINDGYRVWFAEDSIPEYEKADVKAMHLNNCDVCMVFISSASLEDQFFRKEIFFAVNKNKSIITVVTDDAEIPLGLEMQLSGFPFIYKNKLDDDAFYAKLYNDSKMAQCKSAPAVTESYVAPVVAEEPAEEEPAAETQAIYCTACGTEVAEGQKFCLVCGNRLAVSEAARVAEEERLRLEAEEAARLAEEEKIRLEAEEAARLAEEERLRLEAEEAARLAEEERLRLEAEEAERIAAEEARMRLEAELLEAARIAEEERRRIAELEAERIAEQERLNAQYNAQMLQFQDKICVACGAAIPAGNKFCTKCGNKVADSAQPAVNFNETFSAFPKEDEKPAEAKCPSCGKIVPAEFKFCNKCGTPMNSSNAPKVETPEETVCTACGSVVPDGYKFCNKCGTPMNSNNAPKVETPKKTVCTACGSDVPDGFKFCNICGTPVNKAPVMPVEQAPEKAEIFCLGCGAVLAEGLKFCTKCGHKVVVQEAAPVSYVNVEPVFAPPPVVKPVEISDSEPTCLTFEDDNPTVMASDEGAIQNYRIVRKKTGEKAFVTPGIFVLGRSETSADFMISDNRSIGRKHATIIFKQGKYLVIDNESLNKTYLNGRELEPSVSYQLTDGDIISLANEEFVFEAIKE